MGSISQFSHMDETFQGACIVTDTEVLAFMIHYIPREINLAFFTKQSVFQTYLLSGKLFCGC